MIATEKKLRWEGDAVYDRSEKYRYVLERRFICPLCEGQKMLWKCPCEKWKDKVVFIMLNPSTATAEKNDPTVARCCAYANLWKFRRLVVLNIFALRSTDPDVLYDHRSPVGPQNNRFISNCTKDADLIICAWGIHGKHRGRGAEVLRMLRHKNPHYLALSKDKVPGHPLYLKGNLKPKPYWNN